MSPRPVSVTRVEMIRDGGSFAAAFVGEDGAEYCLFFPINQRLGHHSPLVFRVLPIASEGIRVGHSTSDETEISWEEARRYLEEIGPLIAAADSWSQRYFGEMAAVAERAGGPRADRDE